MFGNVPARALIGSFTTCDDEEAVCTSANSDTTVIMEGGNNSFVAGASAGYVFTSHARSSTPRLQGSKTTGRRCYPAQQQLVDLWCFRHKPVPSKKHRQEPDNRRRRCHIRRLFNERRDQPVVSYLGKRTRQAGANARVVLGQVSLAAVPQVHHH
jgi:hypothetical protein